MRQHAAVWPTTQITEVEITEHGGAWFVGYELADGIRQSIRKQNGRLKGFRLDTKLVLFLCAVHRVEELSIKAQALPA